MHTRRTSFIDRRDFLAAIGSVATVVATTRLGVTAEDNRNSRVVGQKEGAQAAAEVLAAGGNAVDAVVTAALVAGVVALPMCGIGGYGGHLVMARPDGSVTAIDFNSAAPAAARDDMYPLDHEGRVVGRANQYGWLAAGVPGTLAGLHLAVARYGTRPFARALEPAIRYARDGFVVTDGLSKAIRGSAQQFERDPASMRLLFADGQPLAAGTTFRNPELATLLETLASDNSVESFYRGEVARLIARQFAAHGGLVTESDLAAYQAREVEPLAFHWRGWTVYTAPLTAGGLSVLQALSTLKALDWNHSDPQDPKTTHARVEALRLAWHDRLTLLGDPQASPVPVDRLLSDSYAEHAADRVRAAVSAGRLIEGKTDGRSAGGTIHLTGCDPAGMMVSLTLTHGEGFGARVTVAGLGLMLGHGMSRFEPRPGHPNSPRPGSRPLNNMCPTVLARDGRAVMAMGATGGRRIPNTLYDVLAQVVARDVQLAEAAAAPRMHTEGDARLGLANGWSEPDVARLRQVGYTVVDGAGANFNGVVRASGGAVTSIPSKDA